MLENPSAANKILLILTPPLQKNLLHYLLLLIHRPIT
ncbi:hypothetical protein BMETH_333_3 [methanotrophic bacterial endosymbiont of Bathymodiolus sp.]|nr:hypothetical protein BMETH_333_3 [methanotrophic bacterial endosymbiont of Bathymodiolus sp.]